VGSATVVARITRKSVHALALAPGKPVYALVKSVAIDRHSVGYA
jgi:molybdate transport system ATP-binding protein